MEVEAVRGRLEAAFPMTPPADVMRSGMCAALALPDCSYVLEADAQPLSRRLFNVIPRFLGRRLNIPHQIDYSIRVPPGLTASALAAKAGGFADPNSDVVAAFKSSMAASGIPVIGDIKQLLAPSVSTITILVDDVVAPSNVTVISDQQDEDDGVDVVAVVFICLLGGPFVLLSVGYFLLKFWRRFCVVNKGEQAEELHRVVSSIDTGPTPVQPRQDTIDLQMQDVQACYSTAFLAPGSDILFDDIAEARMPAFPQSIAERRQVPTFSNLLVTPVMSHPAPRDSFSRCCDMTSGNLCAPRPLGPPISLAPGPGLAALPDAQLKATGAPNVFSIT